MGSGGSPFMAAAIAASFATLISAPAPRSNACCEWRNQQRRQQQLRRPQRLQHSQLLRASQPCLQRPSSVASLLLLRELPQQRPSEPPRVLRPHRAAGSALVRSGPSLWQHTHSGCRSGLGCCRWPPPRPPLEWHPVSANADLPPKSHGWILRSSFVPAIHALHVANA